MAASKWALNVRAYEISAAAQKASLEKRAISRKLQPISAASKLSVSKVPMHTPKLPSSPVCFSFVSEISCAFPARIGLQVQRDFAVIRHRSLADSLQAQPTKPFPRPASLLGCRPSSGLRNILHEIPDELHASWDELEQNP